MSSSEPFVITVSKKQGVKLHDPMSGGLVWIPWGHVIAKLSFIQVLDLGMRFYLKMKSYIGNLPKEVCLWLKLSYKSYNSYACTSPVSDKSSNKVDEVCKGCDELISVCVHFNVEYCIFCGYMEANGDLKCLEWKDLSLCDKLMKSKFNWEELVRRFVRHLKLSPYQYISESDKDTKLIKISNVKHPWFAFWISVSALDPTSLQYHQILSIFIEGRHTDALRDILITTWRQDTKLVERAECEAIACEWSALPCSVCRFEIKGPVAHFASGRRMCHFCLHSGYKPGKVLSMSNLSEESYPAAERSNTALKIDANSLFEKLSKEVPSGTLVAWLDSITAFTTGCILPFVRSANEYDVITCSPGAWAPIEEKLDNQTLVKLWKCRLSFYLRNVSTGSIGCIWMDYCATFHRSECKSWSPEEDLEYLLEQRLVKNGGFLGITISTRLKGHTRNSTCVFIESMILRSYASSRLIHAIHYGSMSTLFFKMVDSFI